MDAGEHDKTKDPGWRVLLEELPSMLRPTAGLRGLRGLGGGDDLLVVRIVFIALVAAVVGAVWPLMFILDITANPKLTDLPTAPTTPVVAAVVAVGLAALAFTSRPPRFDCRDDATLARTYLAYVLRRGAIAEAATAVGYLGSIAVGNMGPYVVGAACTLLALSRIAPTAAKLTDAQQTLTAAGCSRSLIGALRRNANRPPHRGGRPGGGGGI